ncbi:MAG: hypothetical protein ABSG61_12740 [Gemmatimonadales bacterium]
MNRAAVVLTVVVLAAAAAQAARAQTPAERLARGIRAYQDLDYDSAAAALRAALAGSGRAALSDSGRVSALVYLGATEFFRDRRDSASAAFRRLLLIDPRYRPDQLVFPPEVSSLFQDVRLGTRAVAVSAPPLAQITAAGDQLVVWLYATSYHPIDVTIQRANGALVRTLYQGGAGDSLPVLWDGRAAGGAPAESGHYVLRVDSRGSDGRVVRSVAVPLEIATLRGDTLAWPPEPADSLFKPEHGAGGTGVRALITGLAAAVTVIALPSLVAGGSSGSGDRFAVVGALGVAGFLGFQNQRRPQPIPENIAANLALRLNWQRQVDSVRTENAARRANGRLVIRAGAARILETP